MSGRSRTRLAVAGAGVALAVATLTGCTSGPPATPATVTVTVTAAPGGPTTVTDEQLESLTAPAMCEREAGQLVDGRLPIDESEGATMLATDDENNYLWDQSTDPKGNPSFAVAFACHLGGVNWPQVLGFYGPRGDLLTSFDFGSFDHNEHSVVTSIRYAGGVFHIDWLTYDGAEFGPCNQTTPDELSADFSLSDGKVVWADYEAPCSPGD